MSEGRIFRILGAPWPTSRYGRICCGKKWPTVIKLGIMGQMNVFDNSDNAHFVGSAERRTISYTLKQPRYTTQHFVMEKYRKFVLLVHKLVLLELILDPPKKIVPANYFWIVVAVFSHPAPRLSQILCQKISKPSRVLLLNQ